MTSTINTLLTLRPVVLVDLQHLCLLLLPVLLQDVLELQVQFLLLPLVHQLLLLSPTRYLLHQRCILLPMSVPQLLLQVLRLAVQVIRLTTGNLPFEPLD